MKPFILEFIAIVFSLISTYQAYRKSIWNWVTGMVGVIAYFFIFKQDKNWANMILQFVFAAQYIYGWIVWKQVDREISLSTSRVILKQSGLIVILYIACYYLNTLFHGELSILDATTTALSVVAMTLLAHKKLEAWYYFIVADVLYVIMFMCSKPVNVYGLVMPEHIGSALLYLAFLIIAIVACYKWQKEIPWHRIGPMYKLNQQTLKDALKNDSGTI